jgi:hypothetical protein
MARSESKHEEPSASRANWAGGGAWLHCAALTDSDQGAVRSAAHSGDLREEGDHLLAVADGRGADTASALCIAKLLESFGASRRPLDERLRRAFAAADRALRGNRRLSGEGVAAVALTVGPDFRAFVAWIGDCRAYRFREGQLVPVTPAPGSSARLGLRARAHFEVRPVDVRPGDRVLLCTGELSELPDAEISKALELPGPYASVRELMQRGGRRRWYGRMTVQVAAVDRQARLLFLPPERSAFARRLRLGARMVSGALLLLSSAFVASFVLGGAKVERAAADGAALEATAPVEVERDAAEPPESETVPVPIEPPPATREPEVREPEARVEDAAREVRAEEPGTSTEVASIRHAAPVANDPDEPGSEAAPEPATPPAPEPANDAEAPPAAHVSAPQLPFVSGLPLAPPSLAGVESSPEPAEEPSSDHVAWVEPTLAFVKPGRVDSGTAEPLLPDTSDPKRAPAPFEQGDKIQIGDIERIRNYIPQPFWRNREHFFFEGMSMQIGAFYRDYSPSPERDALTAQYGGQARIGADGALENYLLGRPFPEIDPSDPEAGVKHAWNMDYRHDSPEISGSFHFTYWHRGKQLPLTYDGSAWTVRLTRRVDRAESAGDLFEGEKRKRAVGFRVAGPFDMRGMLGLRYRYLSADRAPENARRDDQWLYIPWMRRVRRFSVAERNDAVAGSDMTPDDMTGFSGIVPQFDWRYLGETKVLAPIDSRLVPYRGQGAANFGPTGLSLANDVWQVREAIILEQRPKQDRHPYRLKRLWVDKQTSVVLYAAAWDRNGELWKLIYGASRWSESDLQDTKVDGLRSFLRVCDILVNVKTGSGTRLEIYDLQPTRMSPDSVQRQINLGRLVRQGR